MDHCRRALDRALRQRDRTPVNMKGAFAWVLAVQFTLDSGMGRRQGNGTSGKPPRATAEALFRPRQGAPLTEESWADRCLAETGIAPSSRAPKDHSVFPTDSPQVGDSGGRPHRKPTDKLLSGRSRVRVAVGAPRKPGSSALRPASTQEGVILCTSLGAPSSSETLPRLGRDRRSPGEILLLSAIICL
jgi:hypothetical protein